MKRNVFIFFVLLGVILSTYWGLWNTFFAQDEWASLGLVQANGVWGNLGLFTELQLIAGKDRMLGSLVNNAFHFFFPFKIWLFTAFAIVLHSVNSTLVFLVIGKFLKNRLVGFVGALFFCVAATSSQAVTWISAYFTTLPNALFFLAAMCVYLGYRESKHIKALYLSMALLIVSYYFKESSLFLLLIIPLSEYVLSFRKVPLRVVLLRFSPLFIFIISIFLLRGTAIGSGKETGVLVSRGVVQIMSHAFVYPVIGAAQIFIPSVVMFRLSDAVGHIFYPFLDTHPMRQTISTILISDVMAVYAAILGSVMLAFVWLRAAKLRKFIIISLGFILFSFVPFIILDRPASSYFESRYYYLAAIGASFLFACLVQGLMAVTRRRIIIAILCLAIVGFLYKQAVFVKRDVAGLTIAAGERRDFLEKLSEIKAVLPDKPIVYIEGDSPGFYGISDLAVPFQQGMGYTAMVWFFDTGKIPREFLRTMYLWNINSQGYQEVSEGGFGFFYKKDNLLNLFKQNRTVLPEQVVGFRYNAGSHTLVNITSQIRKEVSL